MQLRYTIHAFSLIFLLLIVAVIPGCGPSPPLPYQQLQILDVEEAEGYDVYMYIAVSKQDLTEGDVRELLEWFRDVKYAEISKMRIFVWDNPQSALVGATGDIVGSLHVDRENDIDSIDIPTRTR